MMQTKTIIQVMTPFIQAEMEKLLSAWDKSWDMSAFETGVGQIMKMIEAIFLQIALNAHLADKDKLNQLKQLGGKMGMKFKEYRPLTIGLQNGIQIEVTSPYFIKSRSKRKGRKGKRRKQGPNGSGKHLALSCLGIEGQATPNCLSRVVQMAVLCPSIAVAQEVLSEQGYEIDTKTISRYCRVLGKTGMKWRGEVSLNGEETLEQATVVIGIDGGRLRERRKKRGRKKRGQTRQGFHTDWREPKLFTIYLLDEKGEIKREFSPLHDATMGDHHAVFALLESYLAALPLHDAKRIVFCGDGAPWIWSGANALCERLQLDTAKVHHVLDYTHAKQQLGNLLDIVGKRIRKREQLDDLWLDFLWNGQIDALKSDIQRLCSGKRLDAAIKKWASYFDKNRHRLQFATFKETHLPCGSGCVESAIRRVINLRLKAPGSFWTIEMAECFLFLRSQLISGRWSIMLHNSLRQSARCLLSRSLDTLNLDAFQPISKPKTS